MKQNIEFKITGIARIKMPKGFDKQAAENNTSKKDHSHKPETTRSPVGSGNKVQVLVNGLDKNRLERLRKYMEAQTGDVPCYHEAVSFAINTCCNILDIP